ncbi:MAG: hypothetical protein KAK04_14070, partial [Cyclobacteriaceae bacterium]|nr:hypothetical protein [Cyclobacteriaceae bacterium]
CYSYNVIYCFIYWSKNRITDFHTVALVVPAGPCQLVKDLWPVPWFVSPLSAGRLTNHVFFGLWCLHEQKPYFSEWTQN